MSALDEALDTQEEGEIRVARDGGEAVIEATQVGPIGVRVTRVRVERDQPWDIEETARGLPERVRALPERIAPIEIAPDLGGAILRTDPDEYRGGDYFEVEVGDRSAEVRRVKVDGSDRTAGDFSLTREQLGRLLDELEG